MILIILAFSLGVFLTIIAIGISKMCHQQNHLDITDKILKMIHQRIKQYGDAIASETDEKTRQMLIIKQDALADIFQDLLLYVLTQKDV